MRCITLGILLLTSPHSRAQTTDTSDVAHAQATRQRIVEEFGSPAQIAAFHRAPGKGMAPRLPKLPHGINKMGPEDMPAMNDYFASRQQPFEVYDTVYAALSYPELYRAPLLENSRYARKTRAIARAEAATLFEIYGFVPTEAGLFLERSTAGILNRAEARVEANQEQLISLARMKESEKLVGLMLPADEVQQFQQGTYLDRAAKLFKATRIALDKQETPTPYVLKLCDADPTLDRYGAGSRSMLAQLAPQDPNFGEANWNALSEPSKWHAVTAALHSFAQSGEMFFATSPGSNAPTEQTGAENFLAGMPPLGAYRNAALLTAMGPNGATAWRQANPAEKQRMERTAAAMNAAFEILLNTLIVDIRETDLHQPDPTAPITASEPTK